MKFGSGRPQAPASSSRTKARALEELVGQPAAAARSGDALEAEEKLEHRPPGELGIEAEVLREEAEPRPHEPGIGDDVDAVEVHRAGRRLDEAGDDAHERALAGAVGAEQAEHPRRDLEIDSLERADRPRVDLHQPPDGQAGGGHGRPLFVAMKACSWTGRWRRETGLQAMPVSIVGLRPFSMTPPCGPTRRESEPTFRKPRPGTARPGGHHPAEPKTATRVFHWIFPHEGGASHFRSGGIDFTVDIFNVHLTE
jgi:hypothetical protein